MRKITYFLAVFSLIAISMTSCQKDVADVDSPVDHVYNISFSRNALGYVNIPVGKYFIYKVTGYSALDSVAVTSNELDTVNFPRDINFSFPEHNVERIRLRWTKYTPVFGGGIVTSTWLRGGTVPGYFIPYDSSSTADVRLVISGTDQTMFFARDNLAGTQTLVVEGVTYQGVIRAESNNGLPITDPAYEKNEFYWAKGVGIVKRVVTTFNGTITEMSLLRHN